MNYDDIINKKYTMNSKHKKMSLYDRSAQFAPFAALTGYGKVINDASRIKQNRIELENEEIEKINKALNIIKEKKHIEVVVIYFKKYDNEATGIYNTIVGNVDKIDEYDLFVKIKDEKIRFKDILSISIK